MRKRFSVEVPPGADAGPMLVELMARTDAFAASAKLSPRDRERLAIVVEELASNCVRHGAGPGGIRMTLTMRDEPAGVSLLIEDDGLPFDPTARTAFAGPDPETGGGVGLELVRAWCTPMVYSREGNANRLDLQLPHAAA